MQPSTKLKTSALTIVAATAAIAVAGFLFTSGAKTEELKHYNFKQERFLDASAGRLVHGR